MSQEDDICTPPTSEQFWTYCKYHRDRECRQYLLKVWPRLPRTERDTYRQVMKEHPTTRFARSVMHAEKNCSEIPDVQPGHIFEAKFFYPDGSGCDLRPVLVLLVDHNDAVVAEITGKVDKYTGLYDAKLEYWKYACLTKQSVVRLSQLQTFRHNRFKSWIGIVAPQDVERIKSSWHNLRPLEQDITSA